MNKRLLKLISKIKSGNVPQWFLRLVERNCDFLSLRTAKWVAEDPYAGSPLESEYEPAFPFRLGIVKEFWHLHWPYIQACRDLRAAYTVIDISKPDWIDAVIQANCGALLVWPSVQCSIWKKMFDERLRIVSKVLNIPICPSFEEIWLYESKRRVDYWRHAHDIPAPATWIFYNKQNALDTLGQMTLPVIFKPDHGSGRSGILIFRERKKLEKFIINFFARGFLAPRDDWRELQWGNLYLQQYIEGVEEWRMIRIGSSYFGYKKAKTGDFHSNTQVVFDNPPPKLLDFTEKLTELGGFTSMSFDIFETPDGDYLLNEMHSVFGRDPWDHSMEVDGKPGRYVRNGKNRMWKFEEGVFTENSCCNLRVRMILERLQSKTQSIERHQTC